METNNGYKTFFRVEHPADKQGPYNSDHYDPDLKHKIAKLWHRGEYPGIMADVIDKHGWSLEQILGVELSQFVCAADSMEQLMFWFPEELLTLCKQYGFKVAEYFVPDFDTETYLSTKSGLQYYVQKESMEFVRYHD